MITLLLEIPDKKPLRVECASPNAILLHIPSSKSGIIIIEPKLPVLTVVEEWNRPKVLNASRRSESANREAFPMLA